MPRSTSGTLSRAMPIGRAWLLSEKFEGFVTVADLLRDREQIPNLPGVYAILDERPGTPVFLPKSTGGWFKRKNPTVPVAELQSKWNPASQVVYIGKAGTSSSRPTLRQRIGAYLDFGQGQPIGHWGGRFIWQTDGAGELLVAWRAADAAVARPTEKGLIALVEEATGRLPFANLQR